MSWNYRLVRTRHAMPGGEIEECIAIHEVYYNADGIPDSYTADPSWPQGETWVEFQNDFANYQKAALTKKSDILDEDDFPKPKPAPAAEGSE